MRPRRTVRPPRRYEDELEAANFSSNISTDMATPRARPETTPVFKILSTPFNPAVVREKPAAFPSRDITLNWGSIDAQDRVAKKRPRCDTQRSDRQGVEQNTTTETNFGTFRQQYNHATEGIRKSESKKGSLRVPLPISRRRSDSTVKLPKRKQCTVPTIRRKQPSPNPTLGNAVPRFSNLGISEPRLEEVWLALGRNSPSFLNQAVGAPFHGLQYWINDLKSTHGVNQLKDKPALRRILYGRSKPEHRSRPKSSESSESSGSSGSSGSSATGIHMKWRSSFYHKPLNVTRMGAEREAKWRKKHGTVYSVDNQNGPFFTSEFANEKFLAEAESGKNEESEHHVTFGGHALVHFGDLVAQVAIDIYCQMYFEAEILGADGKMVCRNLLDLTTESEKNMHWVIAKRLSDKLIDISVPSTIPSVELDREVRPGSSPLVSSFKAPESPSDLARHLARKKIDWDYLAVSDLEKAKTFLRNHNLPHSLLRDWTNKKPAFNLALPRAPEQLIHSHFEETRRPFDVPPAPRRGRTTHSDSEYHDENDDREAEAHEPRHRGSKQHVPPRPSFAKPGASVAHMGQGWSKWKGRSKWPV